MSDLVHLIVEFLIIGSGRRVTAWILPKAVKDSMLVHALVGYGLWIGALILVIVIVRSVGV